MSELPIAAAAATPSSEPAEITDWAQLPIILESSHLAKIYRVNCATINRWSRTGQIPPPTLSAGNTKRWDRDVVHQHFARRQRMR